MTQSWTQLEGSTFAGAYRLQQWLSDDESGAFFLTARDGLQAVIKLVPRPRAAGQLERWRAVERLSHPNLLPILDCGEADSFAYAVFEYPDDNLAPALAQGGLSAEEKRDVLHAVLDALRYIHSRGMVHGAVTAENIVAVGDTIKLASDRVHPAEESTTTPEDDIRALNRILGIPNLPALAHPAREPQPDTVERRVSVARKVPLWAYPAMAAAAVAVVLALPKKPAPTAPAAPPVSHPVAPAVSNPAPKRPSPMPSSQEATPPARVSPPARSERAGSRSPLTVAERPVWRVVAYTYSRYRDAETKAQRINQKLPGLHASVFTPRGKDRAPYYVALGGKLTRAEAANLQRVARAKGMPRDTFIRNFSD